MQNDSMVSECQELHGMREDQSINSRVLARQAIAELEKLRSVLDDTQAYWLLGMIDVLRVYIDQLPTVPDRILTQHNSDGIILRRGLQSFVVGQEEFAEVQNAFRRSNHYRKRQRVSNGRRRITST